MRYYIEYSPGRRNRPGRFFFRKSVTSPTGNRSCEIEQVPFQSDRKEVKTVTDDAIISLLEQRDESALRAIERQYGGAGRSIAAQILGNEQDAQEVFQDTLMRLWNAIPPERPDSLFSYLCTVLRRLAYNRRAGQNAEKRGGGQRALVLDELSDITADSTALEDIVSEHLLTEAVNRFLSGLKPDARAVFIQRYGNQRPVQQIAELYEMSESKVKVTLLRTRKKLRAYLKKEGLL